MNEDVMRKIQALLKKAESTEHEAEAESFYAKAQELMLNYAIDEEMLRQAAPKQDRAKPLLRTFIYSSNDANHPGKKQLLAAVARNNRCRVVFHAAYRVDFKATLCGFEQDAAFSELLYTSLLIQAYREGRREHRATRSPAGIKTYMTSFLLGYALKVGVRLEAANRQATVGAESRALVLVDRAAEVDDFYKQAFPKLGHTPNYRRVDHAAQGAGWAAGDRADLSGGRNRVGTAGGRKLIGGGR